MRNGVSVIIIFPILYIAPSFTKILLTVFNIIFKSCPMLQLSIYFVSRFTTSSKSVILLRPLTCHSPVIPGRNAMRARWWDSYFSHSSIVGGLVPTRLISPFSTLINCGNSSKLVRRMNWPMPVFFVLYTSIGI